MKQPIEFPSLRGTLMNTGSGSLLNFMGAATGKTSFVFLTIALTMSLNDAVGPYSVTLKFFIY